MATVYFFKIITVKNVYFLINIKEAFHSFLVENIKKNNISNSCSKLIIKIFFINIL